MLFNSIDFGIFFPIVLILYWVVFNRSNQIRNIFLIAVSYLFYGWWDWRFLSLIVISSFVDFYLGKKIHEEDDQTKRKRLLWGSLIVNLGILGFFKYFNFFVDSFVGVFSLFGTEFNVTTLNILLPVGISFYTFQTLSYTLDIYYRKMEPTKDAFAFFAFISFFPQLVAGPIERAKDLLPQFFVRKTVNYELLRSGMLLMAWGLFKKIVIADRLARFVDAAYGAEMIEGASATVAIFAAIFFAFQLYLDFSAYSEIAIGSARMLGFKLSTNFMRPYLSKSFSDFWNRWHISLSSWFRDYVYIPAGGNRGSNFKTKRNIMIVFLLSGLWHGASWNFVIWGAVNGFFIILLDRFLSNKNNNPAIRVFTSLFVSVLWTVSLIFFRAQTFQDAMTMFGNFFAGNVSDLYEYGLNAAEFKFTLAVLAFFIVFEIIQEQRSNLYEWFVSMNVALRWSVYLFIAFFIVFFGSYGVGLNDSNFIYFQF